MSEFEHPVKADPKVFEITTALFGKIQDLNRLIRQAADLGLKVEIIQDKFYSGHRRIPVLEIDVAVPDELLTHHSE